MNDKMKNEKLIAYFPVTLFIALTFLLEAFGTEKATNLVIAVFLSLMAFGVHSAHTKEIIGEHVGFKQVNVYFAIMSFLFVLIVANGIVHWYKLISINLRFTFFIILMLMYFFVLFRAVGILYQIKFPKK